MVGSGMRIAFVLVVGLVLGACKSDPQKCEEACRNYAQLVFWEKADAEVAAAPREQRDELRKKKLAEFTKNLELGLDTCTSKCLSANNDTDMNCMIKAKTAKEVKACVAD
jgi:hypothetical protein